MTFNTSKTLCVISPRGLLDLNPRAAGGYFTPLHNGTKNPEKRLKPWHTVTHLRVLSESYPMNTNTTGLRWSIKFFASLCFGRK